MDALSPTSLSPSAAGSSSPVPPPGHRPPQRRPAALAWLAAVLLALAAFTLAQVPWLEAGRAPGLFLLPAIVAAAWYGGLGPGLLAVGLGAAAFAWVLAPGDLESLTDPAQLLLVVCFLAVGGGLAFLAARARTLVERLRAGREETEHSLARLRLHQRVTTALSSALTSEEAMSAFARVMVETLADYCITYAVEGDTLRRVGFAHAEPAQEPLLRELGEQLPPRLADEQGAGYAVRTGKPALAREIDALFLRRAAPTPEHLRIAEALGPRSMMVLPLAARGHMVGAVALATTERSGRRFEESDLVAAQELMSSAALALDNRRLLDMARRQAQRRADLQRLFAEAARRIPSSFAAEEALRQLASLAVDHLADLAIVDFIEPRQQQPRRVEVLTRAPGKQEIAAQVRTWYPPDLDNPAHPAARALRHGETTLVERVDDETMRAAARDKRHLAMMRALGAHSSLTVPIAARGHAIGALTLSSFDPARPLGSDDVEIASELATIAGLALDNARLYAELQEAIRMRDDILAVVAHDLRNPLHVISNLVGVLEARFAARGEAGQPLSAIRRSLERADHLIQDLLDISRMEAGRFTVDPQPVAPAEVLAEVCETAEVQSRDRQVKIRCECAATCPGVRADRARLVQALINLIDNGLAHSPVGGVLRVGASARGKEVVFSVSDEGPGIHPEHLGRLFDRFWQGREGRGAAGLGLAIVKGIVEAHGGSVWVESEVGRGSSFRFAVPCNDAVVARPLDAGDDTAVG